MTTNITTKELKQYLSKNEPALYKTIGKHLNNPIKVLDLLIRHYQWTYQWGDIRNNDMGDKLNDNYRLLFVFIMENNSDIFNRFVNFMINSFKVAFDYKSKTWDKKLIINIIIKNKNTDWYDMLAFYTLMAGNYDDMIPLLANLELDPSINIPKRNCIKLFDLIITDKFANELIGTFRSEINNIKRN